MATSDTIDTQRANRRLIRESMSAPLLTREHELTSPGSGAITAARRRCTS
jgi:hypothetical protein